MLPDQVSNPGLRALESGVLPTALRGLVAAVLVILLYTLHFFILQMLVLSYILTICWVLVSALLAIPAGLLILLIYLQDDRDIQCINLLNYGNVYYIKIIIVLELSAYW